MSYTKKTWVTGETITATDLNRMEDGIDNDVFFRIAMSAGEYDESVDAAVFTLDKSYQEIINAINDSKIPMLYQPISPSADYYSKVEFKIPNLHINVDHGNSTYTLELMGYTFESSTIDGTLKAIG